jgi:predicted DCC family thiol-disulfide oxidoreductase YuxK
MLALAFAIAAAAAIPWLRAGVFAAAASLYVAWLVVAIVRPGCACEPAGFLVALLFGFDPLRVAGRRGTAPATIFYDGDCGLCHRAVRFCIAEDTHGTRFRFAPLQGAEIHRRLDEARRRGLPDSIVVLAADGRVLMRAGAVRSILAALGGLWTIASELGRLVPDALGDALYDVVARWRKRLFAAPRDRCPVTPPGLRGRFILD